jgi:hypothetical protein
MASYVDQGTTRTGVVSEDPRSQTEATRVGCLIYLAVTQARHPCDLAELYRVTTKRLNEAVRRNRKRFPEDFMFQLTDSEYQVLRSQIATSKIGRGGRRYLPRAFTEQGVAMLSGVLTSDVAIEANINIMRAFIQVKRLGMTILDIRRKLDGMEKKYDHQFKIVFDAIRQLIAPPPAPEKKLKIGFTPPEKK